MTIGNDARDAELMGVRVKMDIGNSTLIGYLPCSGCGAVLSSQQRSCHVCDPDEYVMHQVIKARVQLAAFEVELSRFLETPAGRFASFLAHRGRP
jgi:hypothetical protein